MRLRLIGALAGMVIAGPAVTAPSPSVAPAATEMRAAPAAAPGHSGPGAVMPRRGPSVVEHYVDLNSASRQELMTLPGIGAPEATRIIASRPYLTKTELVTKEVLPLGPFVSLKHLVVAMPTAQSKGRH